MFILYVLLKRKVGENENCYVFAGGRAFSLIISVKLMDMLVDQSSLYTGQ